MKCSYKGDYNIPHSKKRRIKSSVNEKSLAAIMGSEICPSVYIRNEAKKCMKEGKFKIEINIILKSVRNF